jgi:hypothetical protein
MLTHAMAVLPAQNKPNNRKPAEATAPVSACAAMGMEAIQPAITATQ